MSGYRKFIIPGYPPAHPAQAANQESELGKVGEMSNTSAHMAAFSSVPGVDHNTPIAEDHVAHLEADMSAERKPAMELTSLSQEQVGDHSTSIPEDLAANVANTANVAWQISEFSNISSTTAEMATLSEARDRRRPLAPCLHTFVAGERPRTARCTACGFTVPVLTELLVKEIPA